MKGNTGSIIGIGIVLAVFMMLLTLPFWYTGGKASPTPQIDLQTDAIRSLTEKQCVAPTDYMKTKHMRLLDQWRNDVVRNNDRTHLTPDGRSFKKSLTKTCLQCHSNKEQFCNRCHNYSGVNPKCWDCHLEGAPRNTKPTKISKGKAG